MNILLEVLLVVVIFSPIWLTAIGLAKSLCDREMTCVSDIGGKQIWVK